MLILGLIGWFIWQNNGLVITQLDYQNKKIPASFNGYKILQISDLHNKEFKSQNQGLLAKIIEIKPDLIVVTGDLIDRSSEDLEGAMSLISGAVAIAPVYYVTGNHEAGSRLYPELLVALQAAKVNLLDDKAMEIVKDGDTLQILGIADPNFSASDYMEANRTQQWQENLKKLAAEKESGFCILISHRPEHFDLYVEQELDLVFTGHAHGGQIRIPLIGALVAPNQGFFPKYSSGAYENQGTTMVVSRGLGNSIFPLRIFNRPEIVVVTLYQN